MNAAPWTLKERSEPRESLVEADGICPVIMLLGRRDEPIDAVRDYTMFLGDALRKRGVSCGIWEVRWEAQGWFAALRRLWKESRVWKDRWVVLNYTALMWSRRGFPLATPLILSVLKLRGCRTAVVFHDGYVIAGPRWVDRARIYLQERIMSHLSKSAARAILPVPVDSASWLPADAKTIFIPVGANVPSLDDLAAEGFVPVRHGIPTVAVFGVTTWPAAQQREVEAVAHAVRHACETAGELQLVVLGRGAKEAEHLLRDQLAGSNVRLRVEGLCSERKISANLAASDVLLFARGGLSTRRGSGLAAIACELPIVAFEGSETAWPLTQAGIVFVRGDDFESLGNQLSALLRDRERRLDLGARNRAVFREWFSWSRIAERWIEALDADPVVGSGTRR